MITALSATLITITIDPAIFTLGDLCTSDESPFPALARTHIIGPPCCALSTFFAATVATPVGKLFMSTFLSFVASLVTMTLVESQRSELRPNAIVRQPVAAWMLVNILSGVVVAPLVMAPASFHHSQRRLDRATTDDAVITGPATTFTYSIPIEATLAIPVSILVGFIVPSAMLIFASSSAIVIAWQFFPLLVYLSLSLLRRALRSDLRPQAISKVLTMLQAERSGKKVQRILLGIPAMISLLSHISLLVFVFSSRWLVPINPQPHDLFEDFTSSSIRLLAINYGTVYVTVIYWLYIEGGITSMLSALKWTFLAGSGAGVCSGWVVREQAMQRHATISFDAARRSLDGEFGSSVPIEVATVDSDDVQDTGGAGPSSSENETQPLLRRQVARRTPH